MKIRNYILSFLIIALGVLSFTGCSSKVKLTLNVNPEQGIIMFSESEEDITSTAEFTLKKNSEVTVNAIAKDGYIFNGWTGTDPYHSDLADYTFKLKKNASITANFTKINYTIALNFNGGKASDGSKNAADLTNIKVGEAFTLPTFNDADNSGRFLGWYYGETRLFNGGENTFVVPNLSAIDKQNNSFTLTAKFQTPVTVTFSVDGVETSDTYYVGDALNFPSTDKTGFTFLGWFNGDEKYESSTLTVEQNITLTAKFAQNYTITFAGEGVNDGSDNQIEIPAINVYAGMKNIMLEQINCGNPELTTTTMKFRGWALNDEVYSAIIEEYNFNSDIILTAKFSKKYKITYYSNGGEEKAGSYIFQDDYFSNENLQAPRRDAGCSSINSVVPTFRGWTLNNQIVTTETQFTYEHNISLIAQWNIYYVSIQYENTPKDWGAVYTLACTGEQLMKDIIPYTSIQQANAITSTVDMQNSANNSILHWTLNPDYNVDYKIGDMELVTSTVAQFSAKARTAAVDGIDKAGFDYDSVLCETFVMADEYGTPEISTDLLGNSYLEIENTNYAFALYAAYKANNLA